jgi:hypothetical protein
VGGRLGRGRAQAGHGRVGRLDEGGLARSGGAQARAEGGASAGAQAARRGERGEGGRARRGERGDGRASAATLLETSEGEDAR